MAGDPVFELYTRTAPEQLWRALTDGSTAPLRAARKQTRTHSDLDSGLKTLPETGEPLVLSA